MSIPPGPKGDCGHAGAIVWSSTFNCFVCPDCYKEVVKPLTEAK